MEEIIEKIQSEFKEEYLGSTANNKELFIIFKKKDVRIPMKDVTEDNIIKLIKDKLK